MKRGQKQGENGAKIRQIQSKNIAEIGQKKVQKNRQKNGKKTAKKAPKRPKRPKTGRNQGENWAKIGGIFWIKIG